MNYIVVNVISFLKFCFLLVAKNFCKKQNGLQIIVAGKKSFVDNFICSNFSFLDIDVSTNADVPNKSTIPTSEWLLSVSKASKSTSQGEITSNFQVQVKLFIFIINHYLAVYFEILASKYFPSTLVTISIKTARSLLPWSWRMTLKCQLLILIQYSDYSTKLKIPSQYLT